MFGKKQPTEKVTLSNGDIVHLRKGKFSFYSIVYPPKKEDGKVDWNQVRRALLSDVLSTIPYLIVIGVLLLMLLPGAHELKVQCEKSLNQCLDDACSICNGDITNKDNGLNFSLDVGGNANETS